MSRRWSVVLAEVPCARKLCATMMSPAFTCGTTICGLRNFFWPASLTSPQCTEPRRRLLPEQFGELLVAARQDVEAAGRIRLDVGQGHALQDVEHVERRLLAHVDMEVAADLALGREAGEGRGQLDVIDRRRRFRGSPAPAGRARGGQRHEGGMAAVADLAPRFVLRTLPALGELRIQPVGGVAGRAQQGGRHRPRHDRIAVPAQLLPVAGPEHHAG